MSPERPPLADRAVRLIRELWPIFGGLVLVGIAYATLGARVSVAEETAARAEKRAEKAEEKAEKATDASTEVEKQLIKISTILDERLPKKP